MKIKPYRICDICGDEYNKTHMSMKVKIIHNSAAYYYGAVKLDDFCSFAERKEQ